MPSSPTTLTWKDTALQTTDPSVDTDPSLIPVQSRPDTQGFMEGAGVTTGISPGQSTIGGVGNVASGCGDSPGLGVLQGERNGVWALDPRLLCYRGL